MATYIDVLDTAVKIGLGALISGIATFLATRQKGKQESAHEFIKYRRSLLERISVGFQESASTVTRVIFLLVEGVKRPGAVRDANLTQADALRMTWYESINGTEALVTLVGTQDLMDRIEIYTKVVGSFLVETDDLVLEWDALIAKVDQINSAREGVRNAICDAFAANAF